MAFVRNVISKVDIDGQQRVITLRPMLYEQALELAEISDSIPPDEDPRKRTRKHMAHVLKMLPGMIVSVSPPVLDAEGKEVMPQELCSLVYFSGRMKEVGGDWLLASRPEGIDADPTDSDGSSPVSSPE